MTWAKVDDHANEHRKQLAAGAEACWLWTCGLMYANRQAARDGFIPDAALGMLYPFKAATKLALKLVEVRLWHRVEGGYLIHEFTTWNQTKEQREHALSSGRERAAKSYSLRPKNPKSSPEEIPKTPSEENTVLQNSSGSTPTPTPIPLQKEISAIVELAPDVSKSDLDSFAPDPVQLKRRQDAQRVFDAWRQATGHKSAIFDNKRRARITARLRDGFTPEQLVTAIRNRVNDPYLMGSSGRVYDGVETLLRDVAQVERLIALTAPMAPKAQHRPDLRNEAIDRNADHETRERLEASRRVRAELEQFDRAKAGGDV